MPISLGISLQIFCNSADRVNSQSHNPARLNVSYGLEQVMAQLAVSATGAECRTAFELADKDGDGYVHRANLKGERAVLFRRYVTCEDVQRLIIRARVCNSPVDCDRALAVSSCVAWYPPLLYGFVLLSFCLGSPVTVITNLPRVVRRTDLLPRILLHCRHQPPPSADRQNALL